ncbi:MAG: NADP-dependent malic enzyme [Methanobacteriota archaeon]|nr:MAG: NADP-dependent malic enzyme [Euryarchaeota archaeon]
MPKKTKSVKRKPSSKNTPKKAGTKAKGKAKEKAVKELLKKAYEPARLAKAYHPFYEGKIEIVPKCVVRDFNDFAIWYTPGVAEPCKEIHKNKELSYVHTNRWNTVGVISDGTRVLGLGDIGPEAGMPVMEGKSLLFKYLGGVDAFPLCLGTKDPEEFIKTVKYLQPSLGGVNLEDIAQPKCFYILERLRQECDIPVWHDDQQGTGTIVAAGAINAAKIVGKKPSQMKAVFIGAGAANIAISRIMQISGYKWENMVMCDSKGTLHNGRKDVKERYKEKWFMCCHSNTEGVVGSSADAMKGADIVVAASKPGPGTINPDWIKGMADDAIVFATANPIPEIWPWEAKEAGAKIVATGRSDFPNQVNNSLGFPGIFRGTLDVKAKTISDTMCLAAVLELAKTAEDNGLREDYIVPTMDEWEVFPREATAVGMAAIKEGLAREKHSKKELYEKAESIIKRARDQTKYLMKGKFILPPPKV